MKIIRKKLEYMQENDTMDSDTLGQYLTVEVVDGGAGSYIVISTNRWALDETDIDEFCNTLKEQIKNVGF